MASTALIPSLLISQEKNKNLMTQLSVVILGVIALSQLAQLSIQTPYSPVPVTGQTLGVILMSLILGRKLALPAVASYIALGASGIPVFASGKAGIAGPAVGYLLGMVVASSIMGTLADRGYAKTFKSA